MSLKFSFGDADKSLYDAELKREAQKKDREDNRIYRRQQRARVAQLKQDLYLAKVEERKLLAEKNKRKRELEKEARIIREANYDELEEQSDNNLVSMYKDELIEASYNGNLMSLVPKVVRQKLVKCNVLDYKYNAYVFTERGLDAIFSSN